MATIAQKEQSSKGRLRTDDPEVAGRYRLNDLFCDLWLALALAALVKHGVPDYIDGEPIHVDQIAQRAKLHAPSLYRALRGAAANGIFRETAHGVFEHNACSRQLRSDHPNSWRGMCLMWAHPVAMHSWSGFYDALTDGRSAISHATGKTLYEYLATDLATTMAFSDAMVSNSKHAASEIASIFPFQNYRSVIDLGGGVGTLLAKILQHHPHLKGALFEIEELKQPALKAIQDEDLSARCVFVEGNFLQSVPTDFELYMVKNSMWNWNDDDCLRIMRNVRDAIGQAKDRRFLIIEYIINNENAPWATLYDLQILNLPGGRARTTDEYTSLLAQAGFEVESVNYAEDQTLLLARPV